MGSVAGRCWGDASAHTLQILRLHVGARGGGCFPHALVGALARCRHGLVGGGCTALFLCESRCLSGRQRGCTRGAASCPASLCCPPLHSTAHRVAGLPAIAMAMWGSLCPQGCVERATAISRSDASTCSGATAQESCIKLWGAGRGILGTCWDPWKGHFLWLTYLSCVTWRADGELRTGVCPALVPS